MTTTATRFARIRENLCRMSSSHLPVFFLSVFFHPALSFLVSKIAMPVSRNCDGLLFLLPGVRKRSCYSELA
jgi:hypothetical protein